MASEFKADVTYPAGTFGNIVEAYVDPEGYAVDLAIPDDSLVGGHDFDNVLLLRHQFEVTRTDTITSPETRAAFTR